jgi:hypothetical protein
MEIGISLPTYERRNEREAMQNSELRVHSVLTFACEPPLKHFQQTREFIKKCDLTYGENKTGRFYISQASCAKKRGSKSNPKPLPNIPVRVGTTTGSLACLSSRKWKVE